MGENTNESNSKSSEPSNDQAADNDEKSRSEASIQNHKGPSGVIDSFPRKSRIQNPWANVEDMILTETVKNSPHPISWNKIALCLPGRSGKQCRERWSEHLDPTFDRSPFSMEEDSIILQGQKQLGNKWKDISCFFGKKLRTPSSIKVRWHFLDRQIKKYGANADGLPNYPHISYSFSKSVTPSSQQSMSTNVGNVSNSTNPNGGNVNSSHGLNLQQEQNRLAQQQVQQQMAQRQHMIYQQNFNHHNMMAYGMPDHPHSNMEQNPGVFLHQVPNYPMNNGIYASNDFFRGQHNSQSVSTQNLQEQKSQQNLQNDKNEHPQQETEKLTQLGKQLHEKQQQNHPMYFFNPAAMAMPHGNPSVFPGAEGGDIESRVNYHPSKQVVPGHHMYYPGAAHTHHMQSFPPQFYPQQPAFPIVQPPSTASSDQNRATINQTDTNDAKASPVHSSPSLSSKQDKDVDSKSSNIEAQNSRPSAIPSYLMSNMSANYSPKHSPEMRSSPMEIHRNATEKQEASNQKYAGSGLAPYRPNAIPSYLMAGPGSRGSPSLFPVDMRSSPLPMGIGGESHSPSISKQAGDNKFAHGSVPNAIPSYLFAGGGARSSPMQSFIDLRSSPHFPLGRGDDHFRTNNDLRTAPSAIPSYLLPNGGARSSPMQSHSGARSSPLAGVRSSPLVGARSSPLAGVSSSPIAGVRSSPLAGVRSSPLTGVITSPQQSQVISGGRYSPAVLKSVSDMGYSINTGRHSGNGGGVGGQPHMDDLESRNMSKRQREDISSNVNSPGTDLTANSESLSTEKRRKLTVD